MGKNEGSEEDGLGPFYGARKRYSNLGLVIRFSVLVAKKTSAWANGRLVHDQAREWCHVRLQVNNHAHQGCQRNAMAEDVA